MDKFNEIVSKYIISSQIGVDAYRNLIFNILLLSPYWKMVEIDFFQIQILKAQNVFFKLFMFCQQSAIFHLVQF